MTEYEKKLKESIINIYWNMKNGTKIKIKNMRINHLKNCICLCEKKKLSDNVRILKCALAIKENKYLEFLETDDLKNLVELRFYFMFGNKSEIM